MRKPAPPVDHFACENRALSSRFRALASAFKVILAFAFSVCVVPSAQMGSRTAGVPGPFVSDSKAGSSFIAPAESTLAEAASGIAAGVQSPSTTFYLHGTGPINNPPTLLLDAVPPTETTAKFKDSTSINRNNGNPWVAVGTWLAGAAVTSGSLTSLSDLHVWLGLKNSDDQGTNFDVRVEAYKNSTLVTTGETLCITGITRNPSSAKEVILSLASFPALAFNGTTDVLSLKVLTRVGTTPAGASCGGHANAVGLRLYFDAVSRASRVTVGIGSADTTAPVLTVTQPADAGVTNQSSLTVAGSVSDSSPVTVTVNGSSAPVSNGSFSVQVSLNEGANQIRVVAADSSGNQSERTLVATRDTTPPELAVYEPADGSVHKIVEVAGTWVDATAVTVSANSVPMQLGDSAFNGQLSLPDGAAQVLLVAVDAAGNRSEVIRLVTVDSAPPVIADLIPAQSQVVDNSSGFVTVSGRVTDLTAVTVEVNGAQATVASGGLFTASQTALGPGENHVLIAARDKALNFSTIELVVVGTDLSAPPPPSVFPVVSPTRLSFEAISGKAEPGSRVEINGGVAPVTCNAASGTGVFVASVDLGVGTNTLSITALDASGNRSSPIQVAIMSDPAMAVPGAGQAAQINISAGSAQKGLIGAELPRPLIAIVTDSLGAPVPGVSVTFSVAHGGGHFIPFGLDLDVTSDSEGRARARYVSGTVAGVQLIRATFSGNSNTCASFLEEALEASDDGITSVSGLVVDQNLRALPHALVRIAGQQSHTGNDGRFAINNVPSGPHQLLEVIGRDQVTLPGRWPNISYDIDVLPGIDNNPGRPLFLPKVNDGATIPLDSNSVVTTDTTYELPAVEGEPLIRVTARAGTRVTFPPDATDRRLSVTRIANNRVPMALEDGRATNLYISVQPAGALFDPPLQVTFPNLDRQPPSSQVLLMSFDHDAGRYVRVGSGRVSEDGRSVNSEPGSGIRVGAWHGFPPARPCPETTVLGHMDIAGNPLFDNKAIISAVAWVETTRAVLITGRDEQDTADRWDFVATLARPCQNAQAARVEAQAQAVQFDFTVSFGLPEGIWPTAQVSAGQATTNQIGPNTTTVRIQTDPAVANQLVRLSDAWLTNSGGHSNVRGHHAVATSPHGAFALSRGRTNRDGVFETVYTAPMYGGTVTITGTVGRRAHGEFMQIWVRGFHELDPGANYILVGFDSTPQHPEHTNHYATLGSNQHLIDIASAYKTEYYPTQEIPQANKLLFNDQSLPNGGKFEIAGDWDGANRRHAEHRYGINCDIPVRVVPRNRWAKFEEMLVNNGSPNWNDETHLAVGPHWHTRFAGDLPHP